MGRLAFPTPSIALPVTRLTFEVFPALTAVLIREEWSCSTFMDLALLQSASFCAGSENPPLMGFILKCAPLPSLLCASSPGKQASRRSVPATVPTWAALVVSHHLGGLLRFLRLRACCIPLPVSRFARFPASRDLLTPEGVTGPTVAFPADGTPLEESPSSVAGTCHHALLPSCRYLTTRPELPVPKHPNPFDDRHRTATEATIHCLS